MRSMAMNQKFVRRDSIIAALASALIIATVLTPALLNPDLLLSKRYRGVLILTSALASPLLDAVMLSFHSDKTALMAAAAVTWLINAIALFMLMELVQYFLSLRTTSHDRDKQS